MRVMIWLYRLQQRLSITRHEGLAVLTLTVLFLTGLTVRHVQEQQIPPVAVDSLVAQPVDLPSDTVAEARSSVKPPPSPENPVDINEASRNALQRLPGIGPSLSERIVEYRSSQRPFQRIEELRRVRGIGPKTLNDLRPKIVVHPRETPSTAAQKPSEK